MSSGEAGEGPDYRDLVETAPVGIFESNLKGEILYANKALAQIFGFYSLEKLMAEGAGARYKDQGDRRQFIRRLEEVGRVTDFEVKMLTSEGEELDVLLSGKLEDETISGFVIDISRHKEAEEKLKHETRKLNSILDNAPIGLTLLDQNMRYLRLNSFLEEKLGLREEDILLQPCYEVVGQYAGDETRSGKEKACDMCGVVKTLEDGRVHTHERWVGDLYIRNTSAPVKDSKEGIVGAVEIIEDITERKEAKEALRRANEELRNMYGRLESLYSIDRITSQSLDLEEVLNRALSRALELLEGEAGAIYLLEDKETLLLRVSQGLSGEFLDYAREVSVGEEGASGRAVKEKSPVQIHASQLSNGELKGMLEREGMKSVASAPIFARGRLMGAINIGLKEDRGLEEDKLELLGSIGLQIGPFIENSWLHQELKENHDELQKAYRELKEIDQMKSSVVSNISHELLTPLTLISGFVEEMEEEKDAEERRELIKRARKAMERQKKTIENLITLSRIYSERLEFRLSLVDVPSLVEVALKNIEDRIESRSLEVLVQVEEDLPQVKGDWENLVQVVENLLGNAAKFNREGGRIGVSARREGDKILIAVSDEGEGLAREDLERIFEPLTQLDPTTRRRHGGTGTGLAVAKYIVELHGGEIWAESEGRGKGSTFYFTLPVD